MISVDLNSDVGESFGRWRLGDDAAIFDSVSSANVACGFHAGDPSVMAATCRAAVAKGVVIGAHVAYRDLAGFGRRFVDCTPAELSADIVYQLGALDAFARAAGGRVAYIKPHGALYNAIVHHAGHAQAVVDALLSFDASLPILGLPGSLVLAKAKQQGLKGVAEAFADRGYNADGSLMARSEEGAVLHDPEIIAANMVTLATEGVLRAHDGRVIHVDAASICVHGDSPGAVATAAHVKQALEAAGVHIESFV